MVVGLSWQRLPALSGAAVSLSAVWFADNATGWAAGDTTVLKTDDAGASWVARVTPHLSRLE
jgi:photosystem II stability/assembly factor-like uncharacterized protein